MSSHQSAVSIKDEWLTPPHILHALGHFDLDPCAPVIRPWNTADNHFTIEDDGLQQKWFGRVWCNPPYGRETPKWLNKLADHGNGIALIFARTETKMFFDHIWPKASALLFLEGRIFFHHVNGVRANGGGGAPSVLVAYGERNAWALKNSGLAGQFIQLNNNRPSPGHKPQQS